MNGSIPKTATYPKEFMLEVVSAYRDDPRPCTIAERFGVHHTTVKRWAKTDCGDGKPPGNGGNGGNGKALYETKPSIPASPVEKPADLETAIQPPAIENSCHEPCEQPDAPPAIETDAAFEPNIDDVTDSRLDPRVDGLIKQVEHAYLEHILKPECVEGSAPKDAAAVFKTVAEVELKRAAHKLLVEAKAAGTDGADGDADSFKPGLLAWEKVLLRITGGDDDE